MSLDVDPPSPLRVVLSSGIEGPSGPGIASASVEGGNVLFVLSDGTTLPPVPVGDLVIAAAQSDQAMATIDGTSLTTLDGRPILRSS